MDAITYQGKNVGFLRLNRDTLIVNSEDVPNSDRVVVEDSEGYRYKLDVPLTYKAHELPGVTGYIFIRL